MNITRSISSKKDKSSIRLIYLSVLAGLLFQSSQTFLSSNQLFLIAIFSNITGYIGCLLFIQNHNLPKFSRQFLLIVIYLYLVGLSYGTFFNRVFLTTAINQDFRYVMYFITGCVFAYSDEMMESFHSIMKVVSIIAVALGIYALIFFDFSYANIETRGGTWSLSYTLWWTAGACWIYWAFYGLIIKKDVLFSIGPAVVYIVLGLMFLKREVVAYSAIIGLVFLILGRNKINKSIKTIVFVFVLVFLVYSFAPGIFSGAFNLIIDRFDGIENVEEFDRNIESNNYLQEASVVQLIFGNGIGHYHIFNNIHLAEQRGILNATHLGYVNILYKGGVVFVVFYLVLVIKLLSKLFGKNIRPYEKVCVGTSITYIASLFFGGSWTYTIYPFCLAAPLFYAVTKTGKR